ncbi:hypothetical protein [Niallia endozanthoxylica]|uniref:Uncharacterized protein n=1 Tax=Niallia endozanthoxylica TaxID=2036016 RepID=A0A5J5I3N6_9BACI|nr:hypothetical protein [Niallia endozanthoxylica]KAA9028506.1 hypothetical protein F4V44_04345 [Niallia endozanthoxylica]
MKKKELYALAMTGALTFGLLGTGLSAMAATNTTTASTASDKGVSVIDEATKAQVQTIMEQLKADLAELGVTLPERGGKKDMFNGLDEETKTQAQAIMEQQKSGTITSEEAKAQLAELGVELPERGGKKDRFANLDEATKAQAQAIMEQRKGGTITQEEARAQLAELGVTLPEKAGKKDMFAGLNEETKAQAQTIIEQAQAELAELGIEHLPFRHQKSENSMEQTKE